MAPGGHEPLVGTKLLTHIKCDSGLPVQLLPGFGTVPLKEILWRRENHCENGSLSPVHSIGAGLCAAAAQSPPDTTCLRKETWGNPQKQHPVVGGHQVRCAHPCGLSTALRAGCLLRAKYLSCNCCGSSYAYKSPGGSILSPGYFRAKELFFVFVYVPYCLIMVNAL